MFVVDVYCFVYKRSLFQGACEAMFSRAIKLIKHNCPPNKGGNVTSTPSSPVMRSPMGGIPRSNCKRPTLDRTMS